MISFEKSIGAVIFRKEEDEILFLLLRYRHDHWDFPKGHAEKGENELDAIRREVEEETGISDFNIIPGFQKNMAYFYRAKGNEAKERKKDKRFVNVFKKVVYYIGEAASGEVRLSFEHKDYIWLSYKQALEKITFGQSKGILKKAYRYILKTIEKQN